MSDPLTSLAPASRVGRDNPRARPMLGWQRHLMRVRLMRLALRAVADFRRQGRFAGAFPFTVQAQTHTECNNSCLICPHHLVRQRLPQGRMDPALYHAIADECLAHPGLLSLGLVLQNEPLLDERIYDFLAYYARRRGQARTLLFLSSNGLELTPANLERLRLAGLDFIQISVNADTREEYERICPGRDWDRLQQNLGHLLAQDLSWLGLQISFVRTRDNSEPLDRALRQWRRKGVPTLVHRLSNRGGALQSYEDYFLQAERLPAHRRLFRALVRRVVPVCPYPFFQASVQYNGQQLICTHDWNRQVVLGDVSRDGLAGVWNGEAANHVRRLWIEGRQDEIPTCRQCSVYRDLSFA